MVPGVMIVMLGWPVPWLVIGGTDSQLLVLYLVFDLALSLAMLAASGYVVEGWCRSRFQYSTRSVLLATAVVAIIVSLRELLGVFWLPWIANIPVLFAAGCLVLIAARWAGGVCAAAAKRVLRSH